METRPMSEASLLQLSAALVDYGFGLLDISMASCPGDPPPRRRPPVATII